MAWQHFLAVLLWSATWLNVCQCDWTKKSLAGGDGDLNGRVVAFGDFNADRRTDLFVLESNFNVTVLLADDEKFVGPVSSCSIKELATNGVIVNAVASDFNFDGHMDVLAMYQDKDSTVEHALCLGDANLLGPAVHIGRLKDQGLVADLNGDLVPDIFGENTDGVRGYYTFDREKNGYKFIHWASETPLAPLASPHSNAFVDLDGDCLADLFVTSLDDDGAVQGEIWLNSQGSFQLAKDRVKLNGLPLNDLGMMTFADMDADGDMDIVVSECHTHGFWSDCTSKIHILFNTGTAKDSICVKRDDFGFDAASAASTSEGFEGLSFVKAKGGHVVPLHTGDFDFDGYPDVAAVMKGSDSSPVIKLLRNVPCQDSGKCQKRGLISVQDSTLHSTGSVLSAAFFDYMENVVLDLIVVTGDAQAGPETNQIIAFENKLQTDAFFVKVTVLNGKCVTWCTNNEATPDPEPLGVNAVGPSVALSFENVHGDTEMRYGQQFSQSCYGTLQTPYVTFGLGRMNNYIDKALVTIPYTGNKRRNSRTYLSVIPNAQLVIIPHPPNVPEEWDMKLFLMPSRLTMWIAVALVVTCLIMSLVVLILHLREKYQDELEKRRSEHLFTYHAM